MAVLCLEQALGRRGACENLSSALGELIGEDRDEANHMLAASLVSEDTVT